MEARIALMQPTQVNKITSSCEICSGPHDTQYCMENPEQAFVQKSFTFHERTGTNPQPQALGTTFEARVREYMAAHTERMERFENAISKQREEINDMMAEMCGLHRKLTTSRALEKVLIREEAKYPVTKNINSVSLTRREEEKSDKDDVTTGDGIEKTNGLDTEMPVKEAKTENGAENRIKNEPIKRDETTPIMTSQKGVSEMKRPTLKIPTPLLNKGIHHNQS
ncbi:hypothetical protein Tco_0871060 [Tanacetum coccineum]